MVINILILTERRVISMMLVNIREDGRITLSVCNPNVRDRQRQNFVVKGGNGYTRDDEGTMLERSVYRNDDEA